MPARWRERQLANSGPIVVAMSGGVDSSVVAAMLKQQGHEVIGITMNIWQESQVDPRHSGCCSLGAVEDARRVARLLDIPHYVLNFRDAFRETVIEDFIEEYSRGRTPNPCVQCNKKVKFETLLEKTAELGGAKLATGHYARIQRNPLGDYELMRARGLAKDQSYVLYMLSQDQLSRLLFPLGELEDKSQTRKMAADLGLPVANKPDSQEICFVSEAGGYSQFLQKNRPDLFKEGEIVDEAGQSIGTHAGVAGFTVGQRKGIGLTAKNGRPLFVLKLDPVQNRVTVGHDESLLQQEVLLQEVVVHARPIGPETRVDAKIRYNMPPQPAMLYSAEETKLVFDEPVRAVTPGQIAVAYVGDTVVAGGKIK